MILKNLRLFDGTGRVMENAQIRLQEGRIRCVSETLLEARSCEHVMDLSGKTVIPGLINCHIHVCLEPGGDPVAQWFASTKTENILKIARRMTGMLEAGITTARDLGGIDGIDLEIKKAAASGLLQGPRLLVAGKLLTMTGGHGYSIGMEVDGADEARKGARAQIKAGADVVKAMATGGVMTEGTDPNATQLSEPELRAAFEEARNAGKLTAAHAQGIEGIMNAVKAGVDSVEHGFFLDNAGMELMQKEGTYLVPTLCALSRIIEKGEEAGIPLFMIEKAKRAVEAHRRSFEAAYTSGILIAAGTDGGTPFNPQHDLATELELMVETGMSETDALISATRRAAELLKIEDHVGTVEEGKFADLVVLYGNPCEDIRAVKQVYQVFKEGKIVSEIS